MSIPTISQAILRGDISTYLVANNNALGALFGSRKAAPGSPVTIALVSDALRWGESGGAQTDQSLRETANYLVWLCGKYGQQANAISGGSGGGTVVPGGSGTSIPYIFEVQSAQFANATDYVNTDIYVLQIELNDAPTVLQYGVDWVRLDGGGFRVLIPGFDATANNYTFYVFISVSTGTLPNIPPAGTVVQVHTTGTSVTVANPTTWLIVNPATLLATLDVTLQAAPYDGQLLKISFGGTIAGGSTVVTAITITPNTGYSVLEDTSPSEILAGDELSYKLYGTTWYRIN